MDRDRGRDRRGEGEVTRMGAGESYRPTARARSPPRGDTFRRDRDRSPRRERARSPLPTDSWHPGSRDRSPPRRRSRTPPRRGRSRDNWRSGARTSPRARSRQRSHMRSPRRFSPRRDEDRRPRSPFRRDERRRSRSPYERDRPLPRNRSPLPRRSPPAGPRGSYNRLRSRSPDRRDGRRDDRPLTGRDTLSWRERKPRSPSPTSGKTSGNTSRRSSPQVHSSRLTQVATAPPTTNTVRAHTPVAQPPRSPAKSLAYRERDSARSTPRERSPARPVAPRSPVRSVAVRSPPRVTSARSPPREPAAYRAPPTGPSGGRNFTAPVSVIPPAGPRGYIAPVRGAYSMRGARPSFGNDRPVRPDTSTWGAAPPSRATPDRPTPVTTVAKREERSQSLTPVPSGPSASTIPTGPSSSIPTGPRAGSARPSLQHSTSIYNRPHHSQATPRSPRPHPAMANMPAIMPGGRIDPSMSGHTPEIAARLKKHEAEEVLMRENLNAKEEALRQSLKVWDRLSRDSASMALKSELSEKHVRSLAGEGLGGAAF